MLRNDFTVAIYFHGLLTAVVAVKLCVCVCVCCGYCHYNIPIFGHLLHYSTLTQFNSYWCSHEQKAAKGIIQL